MMYGTRIYMLTVACLITPFFYYYHIVAPLRRSRKYATCATQSRMYMVYIVRAISAATTNYQ